MEEGDGDGDGDGGETEVIGFDDCDARGVEGGEMEAIGFSEGVGTLIFE